MSGSQVNASQVPPASDPRWAAVATGRLTRPWESLAFKIMITRIVRSTADDASPANVGECVQQLRDFFLRNPKVADVDLKKILA